MNGNRGCPSIEAAMVVASRKSYKTEIKKDLRGKFNSEHSARGMFFSVLHPPQHSQPWSRRSDSNPTRDITQRYY